MMETQTIILMIVSALVLAASYGIVWITDETKKLRKKYEEEEKKSPVTSRANQTSNLNQAQRYGNRNI